MNTTVMLWMARHRRPTRVSDAPIASYRARAYTHGSFFDAYCAQHPLVLRPSCPPNDPRCCTNKDCLNPLVTQRMKALEAKKVQPDIGVSGAFSAVRWCNRWTAKANPGLAVLWKPIMDALLKEP